MDLDAIPCDAADSPSEVPSDQANMKTYTV